MYTCVYIYIYILQRGIQRERERERERLPTAYADRPCARLARAQGLPPRYGACQSPPISTPYTIMISIIMQVLL